MSAYPAWALICAILGCMGAVGLLAWNTAQEQRAGRFDSLIAVVARVAEPRLVPCRRDCPLGLYRGARGRCRRPDPAGCTGRDLTARLP